ncbi:MAG: hypothetical protein DLM55_01450 [Acidimicrobiales bacterium]|nr:MAG: hypothetical protein DLM55_01450 [Acidimicrobiales bacterium]
MLDAWATTTTQPGEVPGDTAVEQHQSARPLSKKGGLRMAVKKLKAARATVCGNSHGLVGAAVVLSLLAVLSMLTGCGAAHRASATKDFAAITVPTGIPTPAQATLRHGSYTQTRSGLHIRVELLHRIALGDISGAAAPDTAALVQTSLNLDSASAALRFLSVIVLRSAPHNRPRQWQSAPIVSNALPLGAGARLKSIAVKPAELLHGPTLRVSSTQIIVGYELPDSEHVEQMQPRRLTATLVGNTLVPLEDVSTHEHSMYRVAAPTVLALSALGGKDHQPDGAGETHVHGFVAYGGNQRYAISVQKGYQLRIDTAASSPSSSQQLRLSVSGDDGTVLQNAGRSASNYSSPVPSTQNYQLEVFSATADPASYILTVNVTAPSPSPSSGKILPERATSGKILHLTFDDGPNPRFTGQILDVLAKYGAKATFFVVGKNVVEHPEWIERELQSGHTVANHSYSHPRLTNISQQAFDAEIDQTAQAIGPHGAKCLRPPYGAVDAQVRTRAADKGLAVVLWDVDTQDWRRGPPEQIAQSVIDGAETGNIILMHDGGGNRDNTVKALDIALAKLSAQGWSFQPICT